MNKTKTSWGKVADWYDEYLETDNNSFQEKVILPNIVRLLGDIKGKQVLDLACGQGYFCRAFASAGANVTGADISPELIALAKKHSKQINYIVSGAEDIEKVLGEQAAFDRITIVLAIQNIEKINEVFQNCQKLLKPGGEVIIVLNHPAFRIPRQSSWEWDEDKKVMYRRIDSYMREERYEIDMNPGQSDPNKKVHTVSFHRPLQVYFKALSKNGLAIIKLEEWISHRESQKGPRSTEEDRMRKEIPIFLCLVAKKY